MNKVCFFKLFELQKLSETTAFVKRGVCIRFHQADSVQNEQSLFFQPSRPSRLSKATVFVKRGVCTRFHQAGSLQIDQSLLFQDFRALCFLKINSV